MQRQKRAYRPIVLNSLDSLSISPNFEPSRGMNISWKEERVYESAFQKIGCGDMEYFQQSSC